MNAWDELEAALKTSAHPTFADQMLAGALESDDLLGAYGRVADIVAALQTPAFERELARQEETVAEMARILGAQRSRGRSFGRRGAAVIAAAATMSTSVAWASGAPVLAQKAAVRGFQGVESIVAAAVSRLAPAGDAQPTVAGTPPTVEASDERGVAAEKLAALQSILDVDGATYREEEPGPPAPPDDPAGPVVDPVVEAPNVPITLAPLPEPLSPPPVPAPRDEPVVEVEAGPPAEPGEVEPGTVNPEALGDDVVLDRKGRPTRPKGDSEGGKPADPGQGEQPGNRPEDPGNKPDNPGNRPEDPRNGPSDDRGNRPDDPGNGPPDDPGNRPEQPGNGPPDNPGNRPEEPGPPEDPGPPADPGPPDGAPGDAGNGQGGNGENNGNGNGKSNNEDKGPE